MSDDLVLYYNPQSRARVAHWMLEEIGAPYRLELVDFTRNEQKAPSFVALNPMGKLPTLVHRGVVVTECAAICAYLADAFPAAGLAPAASDPARGTYYRWMFFAAGCFEPAVIDRMFARPEVGKPSSVGYGTYDDTLRTIETALSPGPYVLGEQFSAADVVVGGQLGFAMLVKAIEPRPAFVAYLQRISQRPASQRATAHAAELAAELKARAPA